MARSPQELLDFLKPQLRDFGANFEVAEGLWAIFVLPSDDKAAHAFARELLTGASFEFSEGASDDDRWRLYYVDEANRYMAQHWLEDLAARASGAIRPVTAAQQGLIDEVMSSVQPHRAARKLATEHEHGQASAGLVRNPVHVRVLLDRLHQREPLFFSAFGTLLAFNLIDLGVLLQQLIDEDIALLNELVKSRVSADPFLQSRQDASAEIRQRLVRLHVISAMEQTRNPASTNPYAATLGITRQDDLVELPVDGLKSSLPAATLRAAVHAVRRRLYGGESFDGMDTQAPWMNEQIALPFRYLKQLTATQREFSILDLLYMLERALDE